MRLLAVEHTAGIATSREKWDWISRRAGIELTLLAPDSWIENYRNVTTGSPETPYRFVTGRVGWRGYENRGFFYSGLVGALRATRPDILHLMEEPYSLFALQAAGLCRTLFPRTKILFYTFDNLHSGFRYAYRPSWAYGRINRIVHSLSDCAVASSLDAARILRSRGFRKPVRFVPMGLDPDRFRPMDRRTLRGERRIEGFVAGFAGRLLPMKGIEDLARAMRHVSRDVTLLVLGSGPEKAPLEAEAAAGGWRDRLRIVDAVPHENVPAFLNLMDVLVLPSRTTPAWREQFGRVLIEAMACGVPVIGSDSGAIPEVVGDAGAIVPEARPEALVRAIEALREDSGLRAALAEAGRRRVLRHFTWERTAAQYAAIYEALLSGGLESEGRPAWTAAPSRDDRGFPIPGPTDPGTTP